MHRYSKSTIGAYYYIGKDAKKHFISDCCERLQEIKKSIIRTPKGWHEHFVIQPNYLVSEYWDFEIMIYADKFVIEQCTLYIEKNNTTVQYWWMPDQEGEVVNVARNITEFREFLKREICKEEL